ncbi:MAG: hypothetical protein M3460_27175 [Actinomycetota bacterium]|nr:hypothetical protein [Actinomycetota bacterium]
MEQLSNGWYAVASWGSEGWDLGTWPLVIVAHYDGDEEAEMPWGVATYVEGDITVKEFPDRAARDKETNEIAVFYWQQDDDVPDAPKDFTDGRLGPYRSRW